ncbi:hypothetical protein BJ165DRAFT_1407136 [Panaeolus papilionaceus]|nr:hypothetical protein BJ165DRAFT_1407136 [Panaeolus papilionaceus]
MFLTTVNDIMARIPSNFGVMEEKLWSSSTTLVARQAGPSSDYDQANNDDSPGRRHWGHSTDKYTINNHSFVRVLYFHPITNIRMPASKKKCYEVILGELQRTRNPARNDNVG